MKSKYNFSSSCLKGCISLVLLLLVLSSCKKAVEIGPSKTTLTGSNVYTSNGSAEAVMSGLLSKMSGTGNMYNGGASLSLYLGLSADELANFTSSSVTYSQFYSNNLVSTSTYSWSEMYNEVYVCNTIIAGLADQSTGVTPSVRQQLIGEAKFIRAFIYFYATNLYGDVPLILTNNYIVNDVQVRTPQAQVYTQIIQDLTDAQSILSDNKYVTGTGVVTTDRIRPNKQTASALLARVYLYQQNWVAAESQATSVIGSSTYSLETNLSQVFLKATHEAIWQLQPVVAGANNYDEVYLVVTSTPGGPAIGSAQLPLNNTLVNVFEPGDSRFTNWVGKFNVAATPATPATTYYFAYKYKNYNTNASNTVTEYPIIFRLAEQYLIRAEARAQQGNIPGAQSDLNAIRTRAGLAVTTAATKDNLLTAIAHERQVELFTEWGHRWLDLKRTGKVDAIMSVVTPQKGGVWNTNKQLFPIPNSDILADPGLKQNPGY